MADLTCRLGNQGLEVALGDKKATVSQLGNLQITRTGTEITISRPMVTQVAGEPKVSMLASYTISSAPGQPEFVVTTELASRSPTARSDLYDRFGGTFRTDTVTERNRSDVGTPQSNAPITREQAAAIEGTILNMLGVRCSGGDVRTAQFTAQIIGDLAAGKTVKVRQQGN